MDDREQILETDIVRTSQVRIAEPKVFSVMSESDGVDQIKIRKKKHSSKVSPSGTNEFSFNKISALANKEKRLLVGGMLVLMLFNVILLSLLVISLLHGKFFNPPSSSAPSGETSSTRNENEYSVSNVIPRDPGDCNELDCLCPFYLGELLQNGSCLLKNGEILKPALRKEYRLLTEDEKERFHSAMIELKTSGEFDIFAKMHSKDDVLWLAHGGPAFLPWHREFLKRVEIKLRLIDPSVALPYWDSVLDQNLPNARDSIIWSSKFFGSTDEFDNLVTGAFAGWCVNSNCTEQVTRRLGYGQLINQTQLDDLLNQEEIEKVLAYTEAKEGCSHDYMCKDLKCLEAIHGNVHDWVGGLMNNKSTSAGDPIFFFHHSFVDFIWEMWRTKHQTREERETEYPTDHSACSIEEHFREAKMKPFFGVKNHHGLSNKYTDNMYHYEPLPTCSIEQADCGSVYLFCDRSHGAPRCVSKVRIGGRCHGFTNEDICFESSCIDNKCTVVDNNGTSTITRKLIAGIVNESLSRLKNCFNENPCCDYWSSMGECIKENVSVVCPVACKKCVADFGPPEECSDQHSACVYWRSQGKCNDDNRLWMAENCRKSCNACIPSRLVVCSRLGTPLM